MSILQDREKELRYMKHDNLEEESKVVGNWYRDLIRSYGLDCTYYKLNTDCFKNFKNIIDQNCILKHAYGYDDSPVYDLSANMIAYVEVENDVFQLNKFGIIPQLEVGFYFDSLDFACSLATKCGQYKEYPIEETEVYCEVPEPVSGSIDIGDGEKIYLSSTTFPYELGLGYKQYYKCDMLSGKFQVLIPEYELNKEYTIVCNPYEHTTIFKKFPANDDLYRSLQREICNDDYVETLIYLTFKVAKVNVGIDQWKCYLTGKIHGSVLFYDVQSLDKYAELIHPQVGDLVAIDFPDKNHREKYELTECFDKQMSNDGINPLLHKYIWKCKAKRFNDSYNDAPEQTEGDNRLEEQLKYEAVVQEQVAKKVSMYDMLSGSSTVTEDAVYGGYEGVVETYDKMEPKTTHERYELLEGNQALDIIRFGCGSRLVTTGYDLVFIDVDGDAYQVACNSVQIKANHAYFEQNLRFLKATDSQLVFINIEGESTMLACDEYANNNEFEICLNDLKIKTLEDADAINSENDNFYKFKGTRTYIWATQHHLYAKLQSNKKLIKLI